MTSYRVRKELDSETKAQLASYPELLQTLLAARGITDTEAAEVFLHPEYARDTHDPLLLPGMEEAVARIQRAIELEEPIVVYSDYDMDGIPGAVILSDLFKKLEYTRVSHYIPHRNTEGFGLNIPAVEGLAAKGAKLIITVDCGITSVSEVAKANELGVEVIITDHHLPDKTLPEAVAIVNPNLPDSTYPNKALCGAGVALKLAQALTEELDPNWHKRLLDMAGSATLSDMVLLQGENRALAYFGVMMLRRSTRPGLQALVKKTKLRQAYLSEDDLTFMIAPRINAASRMDHADSAFKLLSAESLGEAHDTAEELEHLNSERKGLVASMVKEARKKVDARESVPEVLVVGDPRWKPGLVGLVAQRLMDDYGVVVFAWGRGGTEGVLKGSCRSKSVSVVELMQTAAGAFVEYGGHHNAGGFAVDETHIHTLEDTLNAAHAELGVAQGTDGDTEEVDARLTLASVHWDTFRQIEQLAPFGVGNPKPIFLLEDVTPEAVEHFGKEKNHLKIVFPGRIEAIVFFKTADDFSPRPVVGEALTLVVHLEQSFFMGKPQLRLRIVAIV